MRLSINEEEKLSPLIQGEDGDHVDDADDDGDADDLDDDVDLV